MNWGPGKSWVIIREGSRREEEQDMSPEDVKLNREKRVNVFSLRYPSLGNQPEQSTEIRNSFNYSFTNWVNPICVRYLVGKEISMMCTEKKEEVYYLMEQRVWGHCQEIGWEEILDALRERNGMPCEDCNKLLKKRKEEKKMVLENNSVGDPCSGSLVPTQETYVCTHAHSHTFVYIQRDTETGCLLTYKTHKARISLQQK